MHLHALKYGDLMGSPDTKDILLDAGPGTDAAHQQWLAMADAKLAMGWSGQATSVLLLDPDHPTGFPAWLDPSFISPDPSTHGEVAVDRAVAALADAGLTPADIRTVLVTHDHGDHVDPRVLDLLPEARVFAPEGSSVPRARPFDPDHLDGLVTHLDTPGHWGPHSSYVIDLPDLDVSLCLAGDLAMSHAHLLSLDHPLAFADHAAGRASLMRVFAELDARSTRLKMLLPGHDRPIFVSTRLRELVR
jgi:glyoxylase-like metal-dependent hydrolase (beta-lactamase superfamily II)